MQAQREPQHAQDGLATPSAASPEGGEPQESVGLSFVDLLYAVPVAVLATRLAGIKLAHLSSLSWTDVGLALSAITLGWVGHHANRKKLLKPARKKEDDWPFTTWRFPQFVVEILIIAAYFALSYDVFLPGPQGKYHGSPSITGKAGWLAITFGLYLVWDLLDIRIAQQFLDVDRGWKPRATKGMFVTLVFALLFLLARLLPWTEQHHTAHTLIAFNVVTIAVLLAYRVIQELVCDPERRKMVWCG